MDDKTMNQLAAYIAGTLNESSRRDIEARLSSDDQLRSQFEYLQLIAQGVRDYVPAPPRDVGIEKTLQRISQQAATPASPPLGDRLRGLIPDWLRTPRALAFASMAVIATQFAFIGHLVVERDRDYSDVRAGTTRPAPPGPFIKVSFRTDTTEKDLRFLVVGLGATIVGGPTQLGDYYLFLEPGKTDWAAQQLRQSQFVDAVTVIAALPAVKE
jgi:hypothetical protein